MRTHRKLLLVTASCRFGGSAADASPDLLDQPLQVGRHYDGAVGSWPDWRAIGRLAGIRGRLRPQARARPARGRAAATRGSHGDWSPRRRAHRIRQVW
jgi:hypothetical protein